MTTSNRIFLITPGRSGTYWISALMLAATNLPLTGNPEFFPYDKIDADEERKEKLDKIWDELPDQYVCTSLLPRKGYLDDLLKKGARFIHLKRDIRDNAYSMYRMHFTPGKGFRGRWYHPHPESTENIIRLRGTSNLTDYQLCIWGCIETRAVAQRMKDLGADVFDLDIYEINDPNNIDLLEKFFIWLDVEYDLERARLIVGKRINTLKRYSKGIRRPMSEKERKKDEEEILDKLKEVQYTVGEYVREYAEEVGL